MAKGDLWHREPGRVYGADFTNRSLRETMHGTVNGWSIRETVRVYHRDVRPDHELTDHYFAVGSIVSGGGFLTYWRFATLAEAQAHAAMSGYGGAKERPRR